MHVQSLWLLTFLCYITVYYICSKTQWKIGLPDKSFHLSNSQELLKGNVYLAGHWLTVSGIFSWLLAVGCTCKVCFGLVVGFTRKIYFRLAVGVLEGPIQISFM